VQHRERLVLGHPAATRHPDRHPDLPARPQRVLRLIGTFVLPGPRKSIAACAANTVPTAQLCSSNATGCREYRLNAPILSLCTNSRNDSIAAHPDLIGRPVTERRPLVSSAVRCRSRRDSPAGRPALGLGVDQPLGACALVEDAGGAGVPMLDRAVRQL